MKTVAAWIGLIFLLVLGAGLALVFAELRALGGVGFTKSVKVTSPGQDRGYLCVPKTKRERSGDEVRPGRRVK
jgi:hypothetical protein